jgi:outer membrane protein insertion porin family
MLGGETTVRGYKNYCLGPHFIGADGKPTDAKGGISSALLSVEYSQEIFSMLDLFLFFDAGSISMKRFRIPKFNTSYGFGARVDLLHRFPFMVGYGYPINPDRTEDVKKFFFSMGGQF